PLRERLAVRGRRHRRRGRITEALELRELADPFAAAREYVVLERVACVEAEPHADLLGAVRVEDVQRLHAGELALDTRIDVELIVDLHVVGWRAEAELASQARELDEVRVERRGIELE